MKMTCENCLCWHRLMNRQTGQETGQGECRAKSPKPSEGQKQGYTPAVVYGDQFGCVHDFVPKDIGEDEFIKQKFYGGRKDAKATKKGNQ